MCSMKLLWLVVLLAGSVRAGDTLPKTYNINLDLPPEERWTQVAQDFSDKIKSLMLEIKAMVPPGTVALVDIVGADVDKYIPYPYNMELVGLATNLKDISVGELILGNTLYEVTAFGHGGEPQATACTSVVAEALNGTIFHGRNLDYNFGNVLRDLTIVVNFQKAGKTEYTGTTFAGMVGLLTGQKPFGYTITLDERDQGDWWMNALEALVAGTHGIAALLIRDTLANQSLSYDDAVEELSHKPLIAPSYIIVGGAKAGQGAVITRDRIGEVNEWRLNPTKGQWYLVETNYDHWTTPPPSDNRRDPAISAMNKMGRAGLGRDSLYSVLSTPPVLNNGTMYTVIMSAQLPFVYSTFIRSP